MLADFASIFSEVLFVPIGKVGRADAGEYLALKNVLAVGGSWVTPPDRVAARDWDAIRELAGVAAGLR